MERRTVTFVLLSLLVWYGWLAFFAPPPEPTDEPVAEAETDEAPAAAPAAVPEAPRVPVMVAPRTESLDRCGMASEWSNQGAGIGDLTLPGYRAPFEVTALYNWALGGFGSWTPYGDPPGPARILSDKGAGFTAGVGPTDASPAAMSGSLERSTGKSGPIDITRTWKQVDGDPCTLAITTTWTNTGSTAFEGPLWIGVHDTLPDGGGMLARYTSQSSAMASIDGSVWTLSGYRDLEGPELVDEGVTHWFGVGDRYFAAYAVPKEPHGQMMQTTRKVQDLDLDGLTWVATTGLAAGATHTEELLLYVGVKDMDVLAAAHPDLENAVELGWFAFFGHPLLSALKFFYGIVGNWGLAIVLLTVSVKTLLFPLTQSAFRSGQAMQAIQPQLAEIREKHADDPAELNRLTVELFREHRVNPLGGCLPMFLQIPVFIALYNVLLSSVELYQTEFLYMQDLSSVDPYCVLPALMIALMVVQQSFTPTANMDPMQAQMMKLMPLIFGIFFFTLPAGLVVYMVVNMVLSVLQQWFIKRTFVSPAAQPAAG